MKKNIITIAQEMHFQMFGIYIEDFQDAHAQIITYYLQEFGKLVKENINDVDIKMQLECQPDKIFLSDTDKEFYRLLNI